MIAWWVGDGDRSQQRRWRDRDLEVVEDPRYGRLPTQVVAVEPRRVPLGLRLPGQDPRDGNSTLVELFLSERAGGTALRVAESGFAPLAGDRERVHDGNVKGWAKQPQVLRASAA